MPQRGRRCQPTTAHGAERCLRPHRRRPGWPVAQRAAPADYALPHWARAASSSAWTSLTACASASRMLAFFWRTRSTKARLGASALSPPGAVITHLAVAMSATATLRSPRFWMYLSDSAGPFVAGMLFHSLDQRIWLSSLE